MHKERFFIGIAIFAAITMVVFCVLYVISEGRRSKAVAELREKSAHITQRVSKPTPGNETAHEEDQSETSNTEEIMDSDMNEDIAVAFEKLTATMQEFYANPQWEEVENILFSKAWDEWTEEEWAIIEAYLEANRELILEIRRLTALDGAFYEIDFSQVHELTEHGSIRIFEHSGVFRSWTLLLDLAGHVAAAQGDYEEAVQNFAAIMRISNNLKEEPVLYSQLSGIACAGRLYAGINRNIRGEELSLDTLRTFIDATSATTDRSILADALATEGYYGLETFDGVRNRDWTRAGFEPQGANAYLMHFYGSVLARPFINMDEAVYAQTINRVSKAMTLPFYEAKPIIDQISGEIEALPQTRVLSRWLLPSMPMAADAQARNEATLGLMQIGLAVEYYHGQHDEYPETLQTIVPVFDGPIPLDPYTGQSFVYEPRRDGFTLYSARGSVVGPGERPIPPFYDAQGNIVWRYTGG